MSQDGKAAIYARIESDKPDENKGAGWIHTLDDAMLLPSIKPGPDAKQTRKQRQTCWTWQIEPYFRGYQYPVYTAQTYSAGDLQTVRWSAKVIERFQQVDAVRW